MTFVQHAAGEDADSALLEKLCAAASADIVARLRQGVEPEDIRQQFVTAAGVLALSMYTALAGDTHPRYFRAGQLSVNFGGSSPSADSLRAEAERILARYIRDSGFAFMGVE